MKGMAELTMKEVNLQDLYTLLIDVKSSQERTIEARSRIVPKVCTHKNIKLRQ